MGMPRRSTSPYEGYKSGFRDVFEPTGGPNAQELGQWEMPTDVWFPDAAAGGQYRHEKVFVAAPTVAVSVAIRLGTLKGAQNGKRQPDGQHVDWSSAFLRVLWGTGELGNDRQQMDLDLIDGTSFPLVARDASFYIVYPTVPNPQNTIIQPPIEICVSVGIGPIGSGGMRGARRTVDVGATTQGNLTTGVFPIPAYALSAIYASTDATTSAVITERVAPFAAATIVNVATIQKQEFQSVPVVQGARGFDLTTAQPATGNKVVFLLSPA